MRLKKLLHVLISNRFRIINLPEAVFCCQLAVRFQRVAKSVGQCAIEVPKDELIARVLTLLLRRLATSQLIVPFIEQWPVDSTGAKVSHVLVSGQSVDCRIQQLGIIWKRRAMTW